MRSHPGNLMLFAVAALPAILGCAPTALAAGGSAGGADIQLSGSASTGSPQAGSAMSYSFHVKNAGPQSATSVVLTNRLHSGYVYHSATVNGILGLCRGIPDSVGGVAVTCDLGTIGKGSQADVMVNVDAPMSLGTYGIDATVAAALADPNATNNFVLINVQVKNSAVATAPGVLPGPMYLRESFGNDLFGNQSCWCRLDAAGLVVWTGGLSLNGPSASGTMVLAGFNHLAISHDPAAGKVVASIEGVPVGSVGHVVSGVRYVGFQGNGVLNDFRVQAGAIAGP